MASLAIVMSYFSVGVALELLYTPVAYYLIDDLGAESGVYTVWIILVTLPWSFKVPYHACYGNYCLARGVNRKQRFGLHALYGWP